LWRRDVKKGTSWKTSAQVRLIGLDWIIEEIFMQYDERNWLDLSGSNTDRYKLL